MADRSSSTLLPCPSSDTSFTDRNRSIQNRGCVNPTSACFRRTNPMVASYASLVQYATG
ncbi:hypothetical protein ACFQVA_18290 [Actinomadura keratinilytica]